MYVHTYIRTHIHTSYIYTYVRTYMNTYIHTHIHTYIHTYVHIYTHIHTYVHTYLHTLNSEIEEATQKWQKEWENCAKAAITKQFFPNPQDRFKVNINVNAHKIQTSMPPAGFKPTIPGKRAIAHPHLRPRGLRDRQSTV